jgi:UDP-N-acetylmuramyl-tripeptide synthetase
MKLSQVLGVIERRELLWGREEIEIVHIANDSRCVEKGSIFVAIKGYNVDGHRFLREAKDRGAVAFLVEEEPERIEGVTVVKVDNTRRALSLVASSFFGKPSSQLRVIGITGTDGKTTTAFLIEQIFEKAGISIARLSTVGHRVGKEEIPALQTTPDPIILQKFLREAVDGGSEFVVMEVSSHALSQERVYGIEFCAGLFTNLSSDHLDYHKTRSAYIEAKRKLFLQLKEDSVCFVNIDDPFYNYVIKGTKAEVISYGIENRADVMPEKIEEKGDGVRFLLEKEEIKTRLYGRHNIYNVLGAIAVAKYYGIEPYIIKDALRRFEPPPGRLEIVCDTPKVVIDYAHTPSALKSAISACWQMKPKRVIALFGCGGDRDREKRPIMGKIAEELATCVIITSDNPRTEDPEKILDEIEEGMERRHFRIIDRREAIRSAIAMAESEDVVLIAGKGHESYQIIGEDRVHFSDREEAMKALEER